MVVMMIKRVGWEMMVEKELIWVVWWEEIWACQIHGGLRLPGFEVEGGRAATCEI